MGRTRSLDISFPLLGVDRAFAFGKQKFYSTPSCLNVWPLDSTTGRFRGGVRPAISSLGVAGGSVVYNVVRGSWYNSGLKIALCLTTSSGTYFSTTGASWTQHISTAPGTLTFPKTASATVFNGFLFQAYNNTSGTTCRQRDFVGGAEADLSNAGGGTAPTGFGGLLTHGDRLWFFNFLTEPSRLSTTAVNDHTDHDYSIPTLGGAYTNTGPDGGLPGEPILAGISHSANIALFGSPKATFAVYGNPRTSGLKRLGQVGPLMQSAWCKAGDGAVYMLTPIGLYRIGADGASPPQPVSRQIPDDMIGLNPYAGDRASVAYDDRWNLLTIHTYSVANGYAHWMYKLPEPQLEYPGGFFPMTFSDNPILAGSFPEIQTAALSSAVLFKDNATAMQYNRAGGETFDSYVYLGPFKLGDDVHEGMWMSIAAELADGSDDVNWSIHTGQSAQAAFMASAHYTGRAWDVDGDFNDWQDPRARGKWAFLKIFDVANSKYIVESIQAVFETLGKVRTR